MPGRYLAFSCGIARFTRYSTLRILHLSSRRALERVATVPDKGVAIGSMAAPKALGRVSPSDRDSLAPTPCSRVEDVASIREHYLHALCHRALLILRVLFENSYVNLYQIVQVEKRENSPSASFVARFASLRWRSLPPRRVFPSEPAQPRALPCSGRSLDHRIQLDEPPLEGAAFQGATGKRHFGRNTFPAIFRIECLVQSAQCDHLSSCEACSASRHISAAGAACAVPPPRAPPRWRQRQQSLHRFPRTHICCTRSRASTVASKMSLLSLLGQHGADCGLQRNGTIQLCVCPAL